MKSLAYVAGLAAFAACAASPDSPGVQPRQLAAGAPEKPAESVAALPAMTPDGKAAADATAGEVSQPAPTPKVLAFLLENYDSDGDGTITVAEYGRGERAFGNLDRNDDGKLMRDDFERRRRGQARGNRRGNGNNSAGARPRRSEAQQLVSQRRFVEMYASFLNTDGTTGIGRAEWQSMVDSMQPADDGTIAGDDLTNFLGTAANGRMAGMTTRRLSRDLDCDQDGDVESEDLAAMFAILDTDDSGTIDAADGVKMPPGKGEPAPDFSLPRADDGERLVTLSSFRGKKPVALIFGSYT